MRFHVIGRLRGVSFNPFTAATLAAITLVAAADVRGAVSYSVAGTPYTQDFDSLPSSPTNTSLQSTIPWTDDSTSSATQTSIPGWYLYHTTMQTEGGANGHQRLRIGTGSANTGSFWSFGVAGTNPVTDRALGNLTSSTINDSFYGLRLTNNTGMTLGQMTISFTAEQWRDGSTATTGSVAQSVSFGYAVTDGSPTNIGNLTGGNPGGISGVTPVGALGFTSPIFGATSATALDGNAPANRIVIPATTFGGFYWAPGEDLWLRWADPDHASNDHGLAIDDFTFSANLAVEVTSVTNGLASSASTWSDNLPPSAIKNYHIVDGHVVTFDAAFAGDIIFVDNGTLDFNSSGSGQSFPIISVESNGSLSDSVVGDWTLGTATSTLRLNRDVVLDDFETGAKLTVAANLTGSGALDFQSNGSGSEVILQRAGNHTGILRFNGTGDTVRYTGTESAMNLEMNSTGANTLSWEPTASVVSGTVTFNQPGTLIHAATDTTSNIRSQAPTTLIANADVSVDLSMTYDRDERRFLGSNFQGNGNILVKGTTTDPTAPSGALNTSGITLNEFEVGAQGTDPAATSFEPYSGTITSADYVNLEIRRNMPAAKFVVNANARMETGAQPIPLAVGAGTTIGEIVVNSGGTLEVGFEQANAVGGTFTEGHHVNHLNLTRVHGKNGGLTLTGGGTPSTLRMQINGTGLTDFDRINAQGNVALAGTLNVLVNPVSCTGNDPCGANANATWFPGLGEMFDVISIVPTPAFGDYDLSGTVGPEDYDIFRSTFGDTVAPGSGADGSGNGVIDAADYVIWRKHEGEMSSIQGALSGTLDSITVTDPGGFFTGFSFLPHYSAAGLTLEVVSPGSGAGGLSSAIPEPSSITLAGILGMLSIGVRRRRLASSI